MRVVLLFVNNRF